MSIHFSGTVEIQKAARRALGGLLQNRIGFEPMKNGIPEDWFHKPNLPHLFNDDISAHVCSGLSSMP